MTCDVRPMIESFTLGSRNLQEVWRLVLPPVTLLELKRMSRLPPEQFRMPDALWVKIVYDFALAYRLRTISRSASAGRADPALSWMGGIVCDGNRDRECGGGGTKSRTTRQGLRRRKAICRLEMAMAGSFQPIEHRRTERRKKVTHVEPGYAVTSGLDGKGHHESGHPAARNSGIRGGSSHFHRELPGCWRILSKPVAGSHQFRSAGRQGRDCNLWSGPPQARPAYW